MNKFTVIAKKASFWEVADGKQKRISKARFDAILTQNIVKIEYRETETVFYVEEVELLSFAELPENVQNSIIEENRHILVEYENWFEHLKEDFHQTLELLGFFNIRFTVLEKRISFTADWDAQNIVNNPAMWESQQAYAKFGPFMRVMGKLGGKAKIAERCITADSVLDELVLEEMYNNICYMYHSKLLDEYNYLISDKAVKDHFLSCKYTKNGLCVNKGMKKNG